MKRAKEIAAVVAVVGVVAVVALAAPRAALAHQVGMSRGDYEVDARGLGAKISLSRAELEAAIAGLDADRDGALTESELDSKKAEIANLFVRTLAVRAAGQPCPVTLASAVLEAPDGVAIDLRAECPAMTGKLTLDVGFVDALESGHRHVAHVGGAKQPFEDLLYRGKTHVEVELAPAALEPRGSNVFAAGLKRAARGIDHLVFAAAIVALAGRPRASAFVAAAFALASAVGFGIVASGGFVPSDRVVGAAVAATLVYVALEALAAPASSTRAVPRVAVPFGLVHGFAYAGSFAELGQKAAPLSTKAMFLGGVELVVLGVALVAAVLAAFARRGASFDRWGTRAIAAPMGIAGIAWFVARIAGAG